MKKKPILFVAGPGIVLLFLLSGPVHAQSIKRQSIPAYGSSTQTETVSISQTAGQAYNTTVHPNEITVSPGFQQGPRYHVVQISAPVLNTLNITVYPNPASHSVTLASDAEIEQAIISVTDVNGRFLHSEKVMKLTSHPLRCASWANGVYMITIQDPGRRVKTIRLIISK